MLLTEMEARGRLCPNTMNPALASRDFDATYTPAPRPCVSLGCMAWRWWEPATELYERRGYCGLAGRPVVD